MNAQDQIWFQSVDLMTHVVVEKCAVLTGATWLVSHQSLAQRLKSGYQERSLSDQSEKWDHPDPQDHSERLDHLDQQEFKERTESQDQLALKDLPEAQELLDHEDPLEQLALQEKLVPQEFQELLDHEDP